MKSSHRGRKAVVAVLASVACLVALAAPSSAVHLSGSINATSHILTHFDSVTRLINDPNPPAPICAPAADATPTTITITHDPATGATHIGAGALVHGGEADAFLGGQNTRVSFQTTGTAIGQITGGSSNITQAAHFTITVRNCAGTTLLCTINATVTLTGTTTSTDNTLSAGETVSMSGATNPITTAVGCNALIRSQVIGSTATISIQAHL